MRALLLAAFAALCFSTHAYAQSDWVIADDPPAVSAQADWQIDDAEPIAAVGDWVIALNGVGTCPCGPNCECADCECKPKSAYSVAYRKAAAAEKTLIVCPFTDAPTIDRVQNYASEHGWNFVAIPPDEPAAKELRKTAGQTDSETRERGVMLVHRNGELWVKPTVAARKVTIETSEFCPPCRGLKAYLAGCGIEVSETQAAEGATVPQIVYAGQRMIGFDRAKLDKLLASAVIAQASAAAPTSRTELYYGTAQACTTCRR